MNFSGEPLVHATHVGTSRLAAYQVQIRIAVKGMSSTACCDDQATNLIPDVVRRVDRAHGHFRRRSLSVLQNGNRRFCFSSATLPKSDLSRRIVAMEQKIDGLVALLTTQSKETPLSTPRRDDAVPFTAAEHQALRSSQATVQDTLSARPSVNGDIYPCDFREGKRGSVFDRPSGSQASARTTWSNLLDAQQAATLLEDFKSCTHWFPFVVIPDDIDVASLNDAKPTMLLAILAVASWKNPSLQSQLEDVFRQEVAFRSIVDREKSLELVQSILVYLAW